MSKFSHYGSRMSYVEVKTGKERNLIDWLIDWSIQLLIQIFADLFTGWLID